MTYAALVYCQESLINVMTEREWHVLNQECVAGVERLTRQGKFVAGRIPPARFGTIEVRPVRKLPPKDEGAQP